MRKIFEKFLFGFAVFTLGAGLAVWAWMIYVAVN